MSASAMAERLGISRSPVTEAIHSLEQEGFVVREPFKAPRVMTITSKFIRNVYGVRKALEAQAAADSINGFTDEELDVLRIRMQDAAELIGAGDTSAVTEIDSYIHGLLVAKADNSILAADLANLEHHLVRLRNVYGQYIYSASELETTFEELQGIVDAALAREPERIEAAMKAHIARHAERLIGLVEGEGRE